MPSSTIENYAVAESDPIRHRRAVSIREVLRNPMTAQRDADDRAALRALFPHLPDAEGDRILALRPFLRSRPEKFFDRHAQSWLENWLEARDAAARNELQGYLQQAERDISQAFLFLREVNSASWHEEVEESGGEFELVRFVDRTIHPAYLRLVEGVLVPLVRVVAHFARVDRGAGTDGLDVWQVVEELRRGPSELLVAPYRHVVRNGIAHGGVTYLQNEIRYQDKKGSEETLGNHEIIRLTDDLLDVCNGVAASLKAFFIAGHSKGYRLPRELLVEELREETHTPWWSVEGCVPTQAGNRTQLLVYARASSRDYNKVQYSAIQTGILAESLVPGYERYFLSIRSPLSWPGWAGFHGDRLRAAREGPSDDPSAYLGVVEENVVFYVPHRPLGRLRGKLDTLGHSFSFAWPRAVAEVRAQLGRVRIDCRSADVHRNGWGAVLNGSVVIEGVPDGDLPKVVRSSRGRMVKIARRAARVALGSNAMVRHLPIAFVQLAVFRCDYRARRLRNFGLGEDLVCTVRLQRMKRIQSPDILGATIETSGAWRIAWNRAWREATGAVDNRE